MQGVLFKFLIALQSACMGKINLCELKNEEKLRVFKLFNKVNPVPLFTNERPIFS